MSYSPTDSADRADDIYASLARPTAGAESTATIGKIIEIGKEYVKQRGGSISAEGKTSFDFIDFPGKLAGVKLDAVAVAATFKVNERTNLTHAIVLVPAISADQMRARVERRDRQYDYQAVAADVFDEDYKEKLAEHIVSSTANAGDVTVVAIVTVPHNTKLDEATINVVVAQVIDDLRFSLYSSLTEGKYFEMSKLIAQDEILTGVVRFHPGDSVDVFGAPHRRDLSLEVTKSRKTRDRSANPLSTDASQSIGYVDGYVDYIRLPNENTRRRRGRGADDFEPIYGLGLNITNLSSGNFNLLEAQQLILQGAVAMADERVLIKAMYPAGPSSILRSSEALNVETKDFDFGFEDRANLEDWQKMNDIVVKDEDEIHVFLQIDKSGLLSRVQKLFLDACDPSSENYKAAYDEVYDAAERATSDNFSNSFSRTDEIGYIDPRVVLLGTWVDANGAVRDLREVDRFFLMTELGLKKRDEESLELWDRVCYDDLMDDAERLVRIETVLDAALGRGNYNITGRATVVELSPLYLEALANGFNAVSLTIATDGITEDDNTQYYYRGRDNYGTSGFRTQQRFYRPRGRDRDSRRDDRDDRDYRR